MRVHPRPSLTVLTRLLAGVVALAMAAACSGGGNAGNPGNPGNSRNAGSPTWPSPMPLPGPSGPFDSDPAFPEGGEVISALLEWDASSARLPDVPLADGTRGTLNVAIYWNGGFAPSEYLPFTW